MDNNQNLLTLSIKDFFTPKMLKFAILPFLISIVVMYVMFFILAGIGIDALSNIHIESTSTTIQNGIPHTQMTQANVENSSIMNFLMNYTLTSWLASFLVYAVGGIITLYVSIIIAVIVIGFLTPNILKEIQKRHYSEVEIIGHSNIFSILLQVTKWFIIMITLFFFLIPLYFVPFLNIIAFNLPLYFFFHKLLTYDVASTIMTQDEKILISYHKRKEIRLKTLALYLISLIPFTIYFGAVFYVIYLGHTYFYELRRLRLLKLKESQKTNYNILDSK